MKKLVIGLIVVLLLSVPVACATSPTVVTGPGTPQVAPVPTPALAPSPRPAPPPPFQKNLVPEEAYYLSGEIVEANFSLTNVSSETIKVDRWPPEIRVKPSHEDETLFSVAAGTQPLEIKPGDMITVESS